VRKIFDTHAHLDHLKDLDGALARAQEEGVEGIVTLGMDLSSSKKNLEIKRTTTSPRIFLAMGIHPSEADLQEVPLCIDLIKENLDEVSAIGEIGLDFWYKWVRKDAQKKNEQRKVYRAFLELAYECQLPAVVHSRGVWRECFESAKEIGLEKVLFHWYSGPLDVLDDIMKEGYFISATPSIAYSPEARDAVDRAHIEQLLIETDSPVFYKNRETHEGFEAEPKDVFKTLEAYCRLKNADPDETVGIFNNNAKRFFNMDE